MIASLLPGLREIRAPLAAGYIWLVFAYFVIGKPTQVNDAPGPFQELLEVLPALGTTATAIAISFIAYLIGSVSQDLFGQLLPHGLGPLSTLVPTRPSVAELQLVRNMNMLRDLAGPASQEEQSWKAVVECLQGGLQALRDIRSEGASESEKPEALRPMVEAEAALRVAIIPPFTALFVVLTVQESLVWASGLVLAAAFLIQAVARAAESNRLAAHFLRRGGLGQIEDELQATLNDADDGNRESALERLQSISWSRMARSVLGDRAQQEFW